MYPPEANGIDAIERAAFVDFAGSVDAARPLLCCIVADSARRLLRVSTGNERQRFVMSRVLKLNLTRN